MNRAGYPLVGVTKEMFGYEVLQRTLKTQITCFLVKALRWVAKNTESPSRKTVYCASLKAIKFPLSRRSGDAICQQNEFVCRNKYQKLPLDPFLKTCPEEHRRKSRKCRERTSGHTCTLLAVARSHGAKN